MATEPGGFTRLYTENYRGLLLTAHALLQDAAAAAEVTRDAFAIAYRGRREVDWIRARLVRLVRRRLRWRPPRRGRAVEFGPDAMVRLHRMAGLSPAAIASIVDRPVAAVESALADAGPVRWTSVRQPVVSRVLARSARQVSRRRRLAGAAVAALAVGVVVPMLRVEDPAPVRVAEPPPSRLPGLPPAGHVVGVDFADDRHGFALRVGCGGQGCYTDLLSTADGQHWTARRVREPEWADTSRSGDLFVLGPHEVVVDWGAPDDPGGVRRVHSVDDGRTWTEVSAVPRRTVQEIPKGARLELTCLASRPECHGASVSMVLPGTGESALLTTAPRLRYPAPGRARLVGGQWWLVGLHPSKSRWMVAVSEDDGRTWTVSALAAQRLDAEFENWTVVANGADLYASLVGPLDRRRDSGLYGVLSIYHSVDGGRSWRRTGGPVSLGHVPVGSLVATADGALLVNDGRRKTLLSRDDGHTFTEYERRFAGHAHWAGGGYVTVPELDEPIEFSADGVHWHDLGLRQ